MENNKNQVQYKHIKNNNCLHFSPLFKSCTKKRRKGVEQEYENAKGEKIKIYMFEELGVEEQDLLYAILSIAFAEERGILLNPENKDDQKIIRKIDKLKRCKFEKEYIQIEISAYELLKEMGKTKGVKNYHLLEKSLKRLALTAIELQNDKYVGIIHLLDYFIDTKMQKIKISLNPISSLSLLKLDNYIYIDKPEYLKLSKFARLLFPFIKALPRKSISINSLIDRFFSNDDNNDDNKNKYKKRKKIINALQEISKKIPSFQFELSGRGNRILLEILPK